MMRISISRLALIALVLALGGCSETSDTGAGPTGPSPSPAPGPAPSPSPSPSPSQNPSCTATLSDLPSSVPARGGAFTFGVAIAAGCAWTARTDVDWADVSPGSGEGNGRPLLQVGEHTRLDTRTLTVLVNNRPFPITQAGVGCVYTVDTTAFDVADEGGGLSLTLNTRDGCAWTAASSVGWITLRTPSGSGGGTFFFDVASNRGGDPRQGLVTIAGQLVNVTQRRG